MDRLIYPTNTPTCEWLRPGDFHRLTLPRPVVLINGAYDLCTNGHKQLIWQARMRASTLICALDSDDKVSTEKGAGRPIMSWVERATAMGFMRCDYVVEISNDEDMQRLMNYLKPDFRVVGQDYQGHATRFPDVKRLFVRRNDNSISTSKIIERCKLAL